jgi:hypothetical protein
MEGKRCGSKSTDNPGFSCDRESMVIVEYRNSGVYTQHPVCTVIAETMRFME